MLGKAQIVFRGKLKVSSAIANLLTFSVIIWVHYAQALSSKFASRIYNKSNFGSGE
jgi:hypothetical protein